MARTDDDGATPSNEFWVAAGGVLTSLAIAGGCLWSAWSLGWTPASAGRATTQAVVANILGWSGYVNLALAGFNLIPAYPLDGGRLLRALLRRAGRDRSDATHRAARIGKALAFSLLAVGVVQLVGGAGLPGLWPAGTGAFLLLWAPDRSSSLASWARKRPASAALRLMAERDVHELPVVADGRVAGIVTRTNFLQLIETHLRLGARHKPG